MSPPKTLPTQSILAFEGEEGNVGETALMLLSTAQQYPGHWCVISTFLATNTKRSTMGAAQGKMNAISASPRTVSWGKMYFVSERRPLRRLTMA